MIKIIGSGPPEDPIVLSGAVLRGSGTVMSGPEGSPWIVSREIVGNFRIEGDVKIGPGTDVAPYLHSSEEEGEDLSFGPG